jgi:hypothetical protein
MRCQNIKEPLEIKDGELSLFSSTLSIRSFRRVIALKKSRFGKGRGCVNMRENPEIFLKS